MEELPGARGTGHGAQDLSALSARALVKHAEEMGVDESAIDAADGAADRKGALVQLIGKWSREREAIAAAEVETALAALSARALVRRAEEAGVDDAQIEAADEAADRRGALTALILERHAEQTRAEAAKRSRLRAELAGLSARALARRAEDMGVGEAQLNAADDAADRKAALMELIMERVQQQPAARGGGASDPRAAAPRPCALSEATQPEPELPLLTPEGAPQLAEGVPPAGARQTRPEWAENGWWVMNRTRVRSLRAWLTLMGIPEQEATLRLQFGESVTLEDVAGLQPWSTLASSRAVTVAWLQGSKFDAWEETVSDYIQSGSRGLDDLTAMFADYEAATAGDRDGTDLAELMTEMQRHVSTAEVDRFQKELKELSAQADWTAAFHPPQGADKKAGWYYRKDRDRLLSHNQLLDATLADLGAGQQQMFKSALDNLQTYATKDFHLHGTALPKWPRWQPRRRVTLCIGNDAYPGHALPNCVEDASAMHDMARTMRESTPGAAGYEILLKNAPLSEMKQAVEKLCLQVWPGSLVTFFFSGHGAGHGGTSYLLPLGMPEGLDLGQLAERAEAAGVSADDMRQAVGNAVGGDQAERQAVVELIVKADKQSNTMDAEKEKQLRIELEGRDQPQHYAEQALSVSWILQKLNASLDVVSVLFLDCCRADPRDRTFKTLGAAVECDVGKALADDMRRCTDAQIFMGLACDPGTVAEADNYGKHSRYTQALLNHLRKPGELLEVCMKAVADEVRDKTSQRQRTWQSSCLHEPVKMMPGETDLERAERVATGLAREKSRLREQNEQLRQREDDALRRTESVHPEPEQEDVDDSHPFRSCLDREYVQKEIRWAWKYGKKIIVLFEKDQRRAGFFDHGQAWGKYRGTEWEAILNIDAEPYQRDEGYAQVMVQKILQKTQGVLAGAAAAPALNAPGSWDLFLSHAQATGGDQVQNASLRLKGAGQEVWYDNAMLDRSTAAMEEGVKHCRCFVLFLTGDAMAAAAPASPSSTTSGQPPTVEIAQPEPGDGGDGELAELCRHSGLAPGKMLERKAHYSDRRQLREDICGWALNAASPEPGCLVLGGPGAGKTALLVEMVQHESSGLHAAVLATHFCVAHEAESLGPMAFVSGVAMQLYKRCRAYREYVEATEVVRDRVKKLLSGDIEGEAMSTFAELVLGPLKKACPGRERPPEGHFVLCIDSLDEALLAPGASHGQAGSIVQLLRTCSSKRLFPPWLKVVATSRDVPEVAQLKSWRRIDLGSDARLAENRQAIHAYINIRLDEAGSPLKARVDEMAEAGLEPQPEPLGAELGIASQPETFHCNACAHAYLDALIDRSGGNFLYVATALDDVAAGMGDLADVGSLPSGLDELFLHFFERLLEGADGEKYTRVRSVFEAIAASEAGVAEADLLRCMRVCEPAAEERVLKAALQGVRQFLKGATQSGSKQRVLVCYHLSFAAWLESEDHDYAITVAHGHRTLAIVQLVALARELTPALADELARACVEELECDGGLTGKLLRKMRPQGGAAAGAGTLGGEALYGLARHLALAIEADAADVAVFGALLRGAVGDVDARSAVRKESLEGVSLEAFLKRCGWEQLFPWASARGLTAAAMRDVTAEELRAMIEGAGYTVSSGMLAGVLVDLRPRLGKRALELALETSHAPALVPLLLHAGASATATDAKGRTALHYAAGNGHVEALRCLLSAEVGAALEAKDQYESTALHAAAQNGHVEALRYLLSAEVGAEVEAKDQSGSTALHLAAQNGHVEALRYLLSAEVGAELEAKDQHGSTALHWAALNGHVEALRYLLS
eukprot:COSAG01_NODE_447_length_16933_cov_9.983426_15_plen_1797_part_01